MSVFCGWIENDLEKPSSPSVRKTEEQGILVVHEVKCKVYVKVFVCSELFKLHIKFMIDGSMIMLEVVRLNIECCQETLVFALMHFLKYLTEVMPFGGTNMGKGCVRKI